MIFKYIFIIWGISFFIGVFVIGKYKEKIIKGFQDDSELSLYNSDYLENILYIVLLITGPLLTFPLIFIEIKANFMVWRLKMRTKRKAGKIKNKVVRKEIYDEISKI